MRFNCGLVWTKSGAGIAVVQLDRPDGSLDRLAVIQIYENSAVSGVLLHERRSGADPDRLPLAAFIDQVLASMWDR